MGGGQADERGMWNFECLADSGTLTEARRRGGEGGWEIWNGKFAEGLALGGSVGSLENGGGEVVEHGRKLAGGRDLRTFFRQREICVAISCVNNRLTFLRVRSAGLLLLGWQTFSQAGRTGCP
jgi:hypothetical protein